METVQSKFNSLMKIELKFYCLENGVKLDLYFYEKTFMMNSVQLLLRVWFFYSSKQQPVASGFLACVLR